MDVCATEQNAKCDKFFTKQENGLAIPWDNKDVVWCNPPYGKEISEWVKKAYLEYVDHGTTIVMLVPARTDTKWFHRWVYKTATLEFLDKRLKFGGCSNPAPFPSVVAIYSRNLGQHRTTN